MSEKAKFSWVDRRQLLYVLKMKGFLERKPFKKALTVPIY